MLFTLHKSLPGLSILLALLMLPPTAFSHPGHQGIDFLGGFLHPMLGLDHLLAMMSIGLWAAQHTRPARWLLPTAFPLAMLVGAAIGITDWTLIGMETGIASSIAILGLLITFAVRLPIAFGITLVSLFALIHGYAHTTEISPGGSILAYGCGFFAATVLLHLLGFVLGLLGKHKATTRTIPLAGATISVAGMYWLVVSV
jgi:urease accessory protein